MCMICYERLPKYEHKGITYFEWYADEQYRVCFSDMPIIDNKEINKQIMTKEEIKRAKEKPLFLKNKVTVLLQDLAAGKNYVFAVDAGYDYDGASICRIFWRLIGSKEDIQFKIASFIHDVLCENHGYVDNDRYFADKIFERLLFVADVPAIKRWVMFHTVDNFQKFCGWGGANV